MGPDAFIKSVKVQLTDPYLQLHLFYIVIKGAIHMYK